MGEKSACDHQMVEASQEQCSDRWSLQRRIRRSHLTKQCTGTVVSRACAIRFLHPPYQMPPIDCGDRTYRRRPAHCKQRKSTPCAWLPSGYSMIPLAFAGIVRLIDRETSHHRRQNIGRRVATWTTCKT